VTADLQRDAALGRLNVSRVGGDTDGDGDVDRLLAFGGRSVASSCSSGRWTNSSAALTNVTSTFCRRVFPARRSAAITPA
jgi:hypothetical protein